MGLLLCKLAVVGLLVKGKLIIFLLVQAGVS